MIWKESQRADFDEYDGCEWKLIHGDVYRRPPDASGLSLRIGWGVQLFIALVICLVSGRWKYSALTTVGSVLNSFLFGFVIAAPFGGFVTGRLFKTIGDGGWRTILFGAQKLPVAGICVFLLLYYVVFRPRRSAVALPWALLLGCWGLNFVLSVIGSVLGMKSSAIEFPQEVNQLPRQVPPRGYIRATVLPSVFAAIFVYASPAATIHMLMMAGWTGTRPYYNFSGMLVNLVTLAIQAMTCGVLVTFWKLTSEDFRWWWASYKSAGGAVVVFAIYAIYFMRVWWRPDDLASSIVFIGVIVVLAVVFRLIVGAMSFIGSFAFVQTIYNTLKME
jgi:transmembrane 9 superfamily protein 2/4